MNEVIGLVSYIIGCVALLLLVHITVEKINKVFTKKQNNDIP